MTFSIGKFLPLKNFQKLKKKFTWFKLKFQNCRKKKNLVRSKTRSHFHCGRVSFTTRKGFFLWGRLLYLQQKKMQSQRLLCSLFISLLSPPFSQFKVLYIYLYFFKLRNREKNLFGLLFGRWNFLPFTCWFYFLDRNSKNFFLFLKRRVSPNLVCVVLALKKKRRSRRGKKERKIFFSVWCFWKIYKHNSLVLPSFSDIFLSRNIYYNNTFFSNARKFFQYFDNFPLSLLLQLFLTTSVPHNNFFSSFLLSLGFPTQSNVLIILKVI